ncbi:hypothetical protein DMN91_000364 [Ooceraea biroi]|uniref:Acylamino-acid-releasing enzyme N-terminal domain-containing protein n=1 Tax=Ooceraea biroi TaxID=2015173 RepID=A0A3L8E3M0_OOCBI|nr:hypothetical protein DMN91_000364 [Ooceraea biroi]
MASTHAISASRMKELVNLYKTAAGYPFLKSMRVVGTEADRVFIQGWWSQRNLEMKTERRFLTNYYLNSDLTLVSTEFPVDCTTELMSSLTHDKRRQAVLRQVKEDTSTKQFIEIWEQSRIVKNYDLAALNVHGDVYTDDSITILSGIPDELSPGQVLWTKGQDVIGVAWRHEPRHLGLVACTNRHSWIFLWKNGEYRKLSPDGHAVHSPRLSPDGSYLVWLQREAGVVPHHNAHALVMRDLRLAEDHIHEIVEVVRTSKEINNGRQFYGIYGRLPNRCWTEDSQYLIFSTPQKMNIVSYIVNLKTKAITEINNDRTSLMVGDVKDNIILFLHTSVNRPTGLIVGRFGSKAVEDGNVYLTSLTPLEFQVFKDIKLEPSDYSYDNDEEINQFNYIYVGPDSGEDKSVPMILIPHGGPHSNFANTFSLDSMFFALAGNKQLIKFIFIKLYLLIY